MSTPQPQPEVSTLLQRSRTLEQTLKKSRPTEANLTAMRAIMDAASEAGAVAFSAYDRSILRSIMDYWASVLRIATDEIVLPKPLKRFAGTLAEPGALPRMERDEFIHMVQRGDLIQNVRVENADFSGLHFGKIKIINSRFVECTLDGATFDTESELIYTGFIVCKLRDVRASGIKATSSKFDRPHIQGAYFRGSDFSSALISGARMDKGTNFNDANLSSASLHDARADGASFRGATMTQIDLEGAVLTNCDFQRAHLIKGKLQHANFLGADLSYAYLHEADIQGAKFIGATLKNANFERVENIDQAEFDSNWTEANFDSAARSYLDLKIGAGSIVRPNFGQIAKSS